MITFNTVENKITITLDGVSKDYFDSTSYLADFPERLSDCVSMGWIV